LAVESSDKLLLYKCATQQAMPWKINWWAQKKCITIFGI